MKRTVKKVLLLVSLVVVMLAAMVITAFATANENTPSAKIAYCNLAFESNTIIQYAVKAEHVSNNSDVTLQIWTEEDYLAGKPASTTLHCLGTEQINNAEHLIFEYSELADKQMGDVVYARVAISGVLQEGVHKYSILQYIYSKLGKTGIASENEKFKTLLQKKLEVGAAAQEYFEYKTDRLVTSDFYQVKVKNGTLSDGCISGLYLEGEAVTIVAPEVDEEGNNFSYWKNSDGKIISERAVYNLTVPAEHDTYTAVYVSSEGLVYTSNGDGTCCVSSIGTCTDAEIHILPISPAGDRVTSIGDEAFSGCTTLKSITLPNSVTSICYSSFFGCTNLSSITLPQNVTSVDVRAFSGCTSLSNVTFSNSETSIDIGMYAFENCTALTSIAFPNNVKSIGLSAFSGCANLSSVTFEQGSTLTIIGSTAFSSCTSLKSITVPSSVEKIGSAAFGSCTSLSSVTFEQESKLTSIGEGAFSDCTLLASITIPSSVTSISNEAFAGCTNLTSLCFEDTDTWYRTTSFSDWSSQTAGTYTNVESASDNATYFTKTYVDYYYWYKK